MDWITPVIAIGNYKDAAAVTADVASSVICLKGCCNPDRTDLDVYVIPLIDGPGNAPAIFDEAVELLCDLAMDGERVLVHCHAGQSRSACVVIASLVKSAGLSLGAATAKVKAKRRIYLSDGIRDHLLRY